MASPRASQTSRWAPTAGCCPAARRSACASRARSIATTCAWRSSTSRCGDLTAASATVCSPAPARAGATRRCCARHTTSAKLCISTASSCSTAGAWSPTARPTRCSPTPPQRCSRCSTPSTRCATSSTAATAGDACASPTARSARIAPPAPTLTPPAPTLTPPAPTLTPPRPLRGHRATTPPALSPAAPMAARPPRLRARSRRPVMSPRREEPPPRSRSSPSRRSCATSRSPRRGRSSARRS